MFCKLVIILTNKRKMIKEKNIKNKFSFKKLVDNNFLNIFCIHFLFLFSMFVNRSYYGMSRKRFLMTNIIVVMSY